MAKYCANCGKELDENADICLGCGVLVNKENKKTMNNVNSGGNVKKKGLPVWAIVLIIVGCVILLPILIVTLLGIFVFNNIKEESGEYIDKAKDYLNDYIEDYSVTEEGTIGDTLEIDGIKFTLKSSVKYDSIGNNIPKEGNEYLVFFFDIENTSSKGKLITYLNFNGLLDDKRMFPVFLFNEIDGVSNLNKELEYGETTTGYVAFEINKNWNNFDLNYRKLMDDEAITFYVVNESNSGNLEV